MIDPEETAAKSRYYAELSARTDENGYISPEQVADAKRAAGLPVPDPGPPALGGGDGGARPGPPEAPNLYREIHDAEQAGDWQRALSLKSRLLHGGPARPVDDARDRAAATPTTSHS